MRPLRIKARVILLTLVPTLTVALLLGAYFTHLRFADLSANLKYRGLTDMEQTLPLARNSLTQQQKKLFSGTLQSALKMPGVESAALFDPAGKLIKFAAEEESTSALQLNLMQDNLKDRINLINTQDYLVVTAPVFGQTVSLDEDVSDAASYINLNPGKPIGWIAISLNTDSVDLAKYQTLAAILFITLLGLTTSILIGLKLGRDVADPVIAISDTVKALKEGRLQSRVMSKVTTEELAVLKEGINRMADSLSHVQETLREQVSQATSELRETLKTVEVQNQQLEVARQQALGVSQTKSEFLANMSHEIRTPMNSILGFTELLQQTPLNTEQSDYLNTIQKSTQSLMTIINEILDFSKIEAGKLNLNPVMMNLRGNIEDVLSLLAPAARDKGLQLTLLMYPDVPRQIAADPLRLNQIFTNLISNAIKFTEQGSVTVRVTLQEENAQELALRIEIQDTGMGLSPDDKNKLFQAFSQGDTSSTRSKGGTGLGLIICKKLVEKMQGEIGLESEPDQGSTFWFTFKTHRQSETEALPQTLHNKRIAVYEAFAPSRLSLLQILEAYGAEVHAANNFSDLSNILTKQKIDAVLLSYAPVQTPNEFQETLTRIQAQSEKPIIVLASLAQHALQQFASQFGLPAIAKPVLEQKLLAALYKALGINSTPEAAKSQPTQAKLNMTQKTVLAVDDNPANLKLLSIFLNKLGVRVLSVNSGPAAIQTVQNEIVDLIFMDVQMPGMNGVTATRTIKQYCRAWQRSLPIIALTADVLEGQREVLLAQGFDDYQSKPMQEADLKRLLNKWLQVPMPIINTANVNDSALADAAILDRELGIRLAGNDPKLAREMLQILAESLPAELTALRQAWQNQDRDELKALAHKLHGGTSYCGTPALKTAAKNLEQHLKTGATDNTAELYKQLETSIMQTLTAIQDSGNLM